ncbi:MAG: TlpA disulfide reductase family protein [Solirubrobacteraceae bacterium]
MAALVVGCSALSACGTQARSQAPAVSQVAVAFKGSPAPLASLHAQADQLLAGGIAAFDVRLQALRGYPVVINKWASWCDPCQTEFPVFQRVAVAYGRQVAFVGVDGKDTNASAAAFLRRFPVTYPSYVDPQERIASTIKAATYYPQTIYIDRRGTIDYVHAGPYESPAELERDIKRYALG